MRPIVGLLAALTLPPQAVAAQEAGAIARRASTVYRALTAIRADFRQVIEDRMIGTQETAGQLAQAGNARLSMRFTDPKGDAIVIDGTHVWLYTPSTTPGQVIRMALSHDPVYGPNVLARILDRPTERYAITHLRPDTLDNRNVDVLEFVPHAADPLFRRAVIWVDRAEALPRRLELFELSGIHRTLDLFRITLNPALPADTFTFRVPPGVRVIER